MVKGQPNKNRRPIKSRKRSAASRLGAAVSAALQPEQFAWSTAAADGRIVVRDEVLAASAPRLVYRRCVSSYNFHLQTAGGDKIQAHVSTRHPGHKDLAGKTGYPAVREEHLDLLRPAIVAVREDEKDAALVVVRVWACDADRLSPTTAPLARVFFVANNGALSGCLDALVPRLGVLRQSGASGDWRFDDKCGNKYLPVGVGGMSSRKSFAWQDTEQRPAYLFPGDDRPTPVPYDLSRSTEPADGGSAKQSIARSRVCNFFEVGVPALLGELATRLARSDDGRALIAEMEADIGADNQVMGDAFAYPTRRQQQAAGSTQALLKAQWALRWAGCARRGSVPGHDPQVSPCTLHTDGADRGVGLVLHLKREGEQHEFAEQDLLLCEGARGGRAFRVVVGQNGFVAATAAPFAELVHGNVLPRNGARVSPPCGSSLMRLIGYNVREVEGFAAKFKELPTKSQKHHWGAIKAVLSKPMRRRMGLPACSSVPRTRSQRRVV